VLGCGLGRLKAGRSQFKASVSEVRQQRRERKGQAASVLCGRRAHTILSWPVASFAGSGRFWGRWRFVTAANRAGEE